MGWIIGIAIIEGIIFLMGLGRGGSPEITSLSDARDLVLKQTPTAWSKAKNMTPAQRSHCFFMPDIEDIDLLSVAQSYIRESLDGPPASARAEFGKKAGTNEYADSFDWASIYYSWLLCCVYHKLHDGLEYRGSDYPLQNKSFNKSFCSPTVMIKEHALTMPELMRP